MRLVDVHSDFCKRADERAAPQPKPGRDSAYHIIQYKGATWFAIGLALVRIVAAILRDERSVLTVSTRLEGEYGLAGVCLGVPCVVGGDGVERIIEAPLSVDEAAGLRRSAEVLRQALASLSGETQHLAP